MTDQPTPTRAVPCCINLDGQDEYLVFHRDHSEPTPDPTAYALAYAIPGTHAEIRARVYASAAWVCHDRTASGYDCPTCWRVVDGIMAALRFPKEAP